MEPISIIVITLNEERHIRDCLDSLACLDYPEYEILVVDASSDNTPRIAASFPSVRVIKSDRPGFSRQRNLGITHARHELVAFTDADCIAPPNWLNVLAGSLETDVAAVGGNACSPANAPYLGKCVACLGFPAGGDLGLDAVTSVSIEGYVQKIATCNVIFRKSVLDSLNGFNETSVWGGEDSDICDRITHSGGKIKYCRDSFVFHKTRDCLKSFARWCYRRGKARYHYSQNRPRILIGLGLTVTLIFLSAIKPRVTFTLGLIALAAAISGILFTSKFQHLISRRKRINISLASIISVIASLELLRHVIMLAGEAKEALNTGIGKMIKRLNPGKMSDRSPG